MKLILQADVEHLGRMGDLVDVADGYARNFLLPRKKGVFASTKNVAAFEHQKRLVAIQMKKVRTEAEREAEKVSAARVCISVQMGEQGKMFGSVTARDIADALAAQGIVVDRKQILLEQPIREPGSSNVPVKINHDVIAQVRVDVVPSEETPTPADPESPEEKRSNMQAGETEATDG